MKLLIDIDVVPVEERDFHRALALDTPDFEDAVQAACALKIGVDHLVTRNLQDFDGPPIDAVSPGMALAAL